MSVPSKFADPQCVNWLRCVTSLMILKESLHDYTQDGVNRLHVNVKNGITAQLRSQHQCSDCSWKKIHQKKSTHDWQINCKLNICNIWLNVILSQHNEPQCKTINWCNADITQWPTDPWEIAKIYMTKGQWNNANLPQELDSPALLSLLKFCKAFDPIDVQLVSKIIDTKNSVLHSPDLRVSDADKDAWIDNMLKLISSLNIQGVIYTAIDKLKTEEMDIRFQDQILKAIHSLVSEVLSEVTTLKNTQIQHREEIDKVKGTAGDHEAKITGLQTQTQQLETDLRGQKSQMETCVKVFSALQPFIGNNPDVHSIKISEKLKEITKEISELQTKLQNVASLSENNNLKLNSIRAELEAVTVEHQAVKNVISAVKDEQKKMGGEINDVKDKQEEMRNQIEIVEQGQREIQTAVGGICERNNFFRFCQLVMDLGTRLLQLLFQKYIGGDLQHFLKSHKAYLESLQGKRIITQRQIRLFFQPQGAEIKDLSIRIVNILMFNLLKITKPEKYPPDISNESIGADMLRLFRAKECLACDYYQSGMSEDNFLREWDYIMKSISRLASELDSDQKEDILSKARNLKITDISKSEEEKIREKLFKQIIEDKDPETCPHIFDVQNENVVTGNDAAMARISTWYLSAPKELRDLFDPHQCIFNRVDKGSIILKFLTGSKFMVQSLKLKNIEGNLRCLLQTGFHESKTEWSDPVHITVSILSPRDSDQEEIHICLDFDKKEKAQLTNEEIILMVEKMDPTQLQDWVFKKLEIDQKTMIMLKEIVSWENITGQKKMEILLDSVNRLENGFKMLEEYCKKSNPLLFPQIFKSMRNLPVGDKNGDDQEAELSYKRGEGLQELYSAWINIDEEKDIYKIAECGRKPDSEDSRFEQRGVHQVVTDLNCPTDETLLKMAHANQEQLSTEKDIHKNDECGRYHDLEDSRLEQRGVHQVDRDLNCPADDGTETLLKTAHANQEELSAGRLEENSHLAIRKYYREMKEKVTLDVVMDHLLQEEVLDWNDHEEIRQYPRNRGVDRLLQKLLRKSQSAFECFLAALRQTGQTNLADKLEMTKECLTGEIPLLEWRGENVHEAWPTIEEYLQEELLPESIIDFFMERNIFSLDEYEFLFHCTYKRKKMLNEFLTLIKKKLPGAISVLLHALKETNQTSMVEDLENIIKEGETADGRKKERFQEEIVQRKKHHMIQQGNEF